MHSRLFILLFSSLLAGYLNAQSQNNQQKSDSLSTYGLSEVVISANRALTPASEVASSVTIIKKEEIERSNKPFLSDLLKAVPGLSVVQQGGKGSLSSIFLRGGNAQHTLFRIDGVEINDPSSLNNAYDLSNLQLDNIERIEVLRGPQSTLYGSEAMAGVISIFTKKGSGSPKLSLSAEGGSYGTMNGNAALNGSFKVIDYSLSYSGYKTKGFSSADKNYGNTETDGSLNNSIYSRLGVKLTEFMSLDVLYNFIKSRTDLDQNGPDGDDPNFVYKLEESVFKTSSNISLFEGRWNQDLGVSIMRHISHTIDDIDEIRPQTSSDAYFNGSRLKLEWQNNLKVDKYNMLVFGAEAYREKANTSYFSRSEYGPFNSEIPENSATTTSLYLQDQVNFANAIFASAGLRYDKHNRFGSITTFRIAPAYLISETNTKLKFTYGTGFKSPSLYNLFDPAFGNPDLKPEKSRGWDAGVEQYIMKDKLSLGATYFSNDFTDLIGYDNNYRSINIDKVKTSGLELSLAGAFNKLFINLNYTFTESKDKSMNSIDSGKDLLRRPKNKLGLNIAYSFNDADVNLELMNMGKREDRDFVTFQRVELSAYTLVNLGAAYNVTNYLKFFGRIENLLDQKYEDVLYYGTPGVSGYFGIRLSI